MVTFGGTAAQQHHHQQEGQNGGERSTQEVLEDDTHDDEERTLLILENTSSRSSRKAATGGNRIMEGDRTMDGDRRTGLSRRRNFALWLAFLVAILLVGHVVILRKGVTLANIGERKFKEGEKILKTNQSTSHLLTVSLHGTTTMITKNLSLTMSTEQPRVSAEPPRMITRPEMEDSHVLFLHIGKAGGGAY